MAEKKDTLIAKLDELDGRYAEIDEQLSKPEVSSDSAKLISLSKEQGKLRVIVSKYREYKKILEGISESEHILGDSETEEELKEMAGEELEELKAKQEALMGEIRDTLVMADDAVVNSVIMEIRAGTGGDEAALFVRDLYNMYVKYAESKRWKVEQLAFSASEMGGLREVIFNVKGKGAWSELGYEGGGHRVQRVPETESQGRVHTSAATVAVLKSWIFR